MPNTDNCDHNNSNFKYCPHCGTSLVSPPTSTSDNNSHKRRKNMRNDNAQRKYYEVTGVINKTPTQRSEYDAHQGQACCIIL